MKIDQEIIDMVLKPYTLRPLQDAAIFPPYNIGGTFKIGPTFYHNPPFNHATDIEIQLCLNQLGYVAMAYAMNRSIMSPLINLDFNQLRGENMLVIESHKRFKRHIKTDELIVGEMTLQRFRDTKNLLVGYFDFDFENGSCVGELELALIKSQVKGGKQ